jgi:hypothetical protein
MVIWNILLTIALAVIGLHAIGHGRWIHTNAPKLNGLHFKQAEQLKKLQDRLDKLEGKL